MTRINFPGRPDILDLVLVIVALLTGVSVAHRPQPKFSVQCGPVQHLPTISETHGEANVVVWVEHERCCHDGGVVEHCAFQCRATVRPRKGE